MNFLMQIFVKLEVGLKQVYKADKKPLEGIILKVEQLKLWTTLPINM